MNKFLKSLVITALAVSASHVQAHTNKTFLNARSHGVNMSLENGGGFRELVMREDKNRFGGNFQAAFFYQDSVNQDEQGQYFLAGDNKTKNVLELGASKAAGGLPEAGSSDAFIPHAAGGGAADNKIKLDPSHRAVGVYFSYFQDLEKIFNGLYFSVNLPVVNVENEMNATFEGTDKANLEKYFKGDFEVAAGAVNALAKLEKARYGKDSATGIADIDVTLGYRFLDKETYHACVNVGLTIPTGNEAEGKHAFEAIYGNGQHFAFGAGLNFGARVWGDHHHNIKFNAGFNYRYLFEGSEKRTLGAKIGGTAVNMGQYFPVGEFGTNKVQPAANVLTQNVDVTPGSQFDAVVDLAYNNGGFVVDAGYNLYFREEESVKRKDKWDATKWFAMNDDYDSSAANVAAGNGTAITEEMLDASAAQTPSQTVHRLYGHVGYVLRDWETPVNFAVGGHYDIAGANSAVAGWGVNVRAGISF